MNEVSCRLVQPYLDFMPDFGINSERVLKGLPYSMAHLLNLRSRIDWDHFATIVTRMAEGFDDDSLIKMGELYSETPALARRIGRMAGLLTGPHHLYWYVHRFGGPTMATNIESSFESVGHNRIRNTIRIPEPFAPCRAFMLLSVGSMRAIPTLIGLQPSVIEWEVGDRHGTYDVTLPPSFTVWARLKRASTVLFAANATVEQLREQHDEIAKGHSDLSKMAQNFRELIEQTPDGIVVMRDGQIVYTNAAFQRSLDADSAGALLDQPLEAWMHPAQRETWRTAFTWNDEGDRVHEVRFKTLLGRTADLQLSSLFDVHFDGLPALAIVARDVSEQRVLESTVVDISTREQQRISAELHDNLSQLLAGLSFSSAAMSRQLSEGHVPKPEQLDQITEISNRTLREARAIAAGLAPADFDSAGLMGALSSLAQSTTKTYGVDCTFEAGQAVELPRTDQATHVYRIAQEAVTNAIRHGEATQIQLACTATPDHLTFCCTDNGKGLPHDHRHAGGMGLRNMRYRSRLMGATLRIEQQQPTGTSVCCMIPVEMPYEEGNA